MKRKIIMPFKKLEEVNLPSVFTIHFLVGYIDAMIGARKYRHPKTNKRIISDRKLMDKIERAMKKWKKGGER